MDFQDIIRQLVERIEKMKDNVLTEEATKNAFIMPFINALGYDVFNPTEVVPEFICDIGTKKGEKIDYAIMQDGKPVILIASIACRILACTIINCCGTSPFRRPNSVC